MADPAQVIRNLNAAWLEGRYDALRRYFAPDVVMLPPGGHEPVTGVDSMIDSYREFGSLGEIHGFEVLGLIVHEFGPLAVCEMTFAIDYEIEAKRFKERGMEVYVLDTSGDEPHVVWRTQIPGATSCA